MTASDTHDTFEQPRVSIVGTGNWLLYNDRIGPRIIDEIEHRYADDVEIVNAGSSPLAVYDFLHAQELLFIIDACTFDAQPGTVHVVEPDLEVEDVRMTSVHQLGPLESLIVARHLEPERLPSRTLLVLIETEGADDADLDTACQQVVSLLDNEIEMWRNK